MKRGDQTRLTGAVGHPSRAVSAFAWSEGLGRRVRKRPPFHGASRPPTGKRVWADMLDKTRTWTEKEIVLDNIGELVVYHDPHLRVRWANAAGGNSVGEPPEKLIGRHCYTIWHRRETPCEGCPVVRTLQTGKAQEGKIVDPAGDCWYIKGYPVFGPDGELNGAVELALNVTRQEKAENEVRRRLATEHLIARISGRFVVPGDLDEAIRLSLADLGEFFEADRAFLFFSRDGNRLLRYSHDWTAPGIPPARERIGAYPTEWFPWTMAKLCKGEFITLPHISEAPPEAAPDVACWQKEHLQSVMAVPFFIAGTFAGFIGCDTLSEIKDWGEDYVELIKVAAQIIGNALERDSAEAEIRKHRDQLELLVVERTAQLQATNVQLRQEIDERARREEALRINEERYRALFENSPAALWEMEAAPFMDHINQLRAEGITDIGEHFTRHPEAVLEAGPKAGFLDVNQATLSLYQADTKARLFENFYGLFIPETMPPFREFLIAVASGMLSWSGETVMKDLAGQEIYLAVRWIRVPSEVAGSVRVLVSMQDITPLKMAHKQQERVIAGLDGILAGAEELIQCQDPDQLCRRGLEIARDRLGIERGGIFLRNGVQIHGTYLIDRDGGIAQTEQVWPVDEGAWWRVLLEPAESIPSWVSVSRRFGDWDGLAADGEGWVSATPLLRSGERGVGLFFNDTALSRAPLDPSQQDLLAVYCSLLGNILFRIQAETALRQSEQRFRTIFENSPISLSEVDCSGIKRYLFELRTAGTIDLAGYLRELPTTADECFQRIRILDLNETSVRLVRAENKEQVKANLSRFMTLESRQAARQLLIAIASGAMEYQTEMTIRGESGELIQVAFHWMVVPGHEETLDRCVVSILDITERKQYQHQLRTLVSELTLSEEKERRRIASELHDQVGQALAMAKIKLGALQAMCSRQESQPAFEEIRSILEQTIKAVRTLTFDLSPPILYELGLEAAVEWLAEQLQRDYHVRIKLDLDTPLRPVADDLRAILFLATRELLLNVVKHSRAREVLVSIRHERHGVQIVVEDDGVGFTNSGEKQTTVQGFGLFSIRERLKYFGGSLAIESGKGTRTRATLEVPLLSEKKGGNR